MLRRIERTPTLDHFIRSEMPLRVVDDFWEVLHEVYNRVGNGPRQHADIQPRNAKVTADDVREIRSRCLRGETQADLAIHYGVSPQTIFNIVHYKTWRNVR